MVAPTAAREVAWASSAAVHRPSLSTPGWATGSARRAGRAGSASAASPSWSACRRASSPRSRPGAPSRRSTRCTRWRRSSASRSTSCCSWTPSRPPPNGAGDAFAGIIETTSPHVPVQRAASRSTIRLGSGVVWERLTTESIRNVDFLHVTYEVGGESSPADAFQRHTGQEWGYVLYRDPHRPHRLRRVPPPAGRRDQLRFRRPPPAVQRRRHAGAGGLVRAGPRLRRHRQALTRVAPRAAPVAAGLRRSCNPA